MFYIADFMRTGAIKAYFQGLCCALDLELSTAAISQLRPMLYLYRHRPLYLADTGKRIVYEFGLRAQLRSVIKVLQLAAAANAEIVTGRTAPRGRRLKYFGDLSPQVSLFNRRDSNAQTIAGRAPRNEYDEI